LWDFGTTKLKETIPWGKKNNKDLTCPLYSCCFSKIDSSVICAGGAAANEVKLFDRND